jgi:hypothetical protein
MTEVQFTAELAMSLIDGMSDFSAPRIDAAYKRWDDAFPERAEVSRRLDRVYKKIASVNQEAIKDTIFQRSPLFYSLVLVLDDMNRLPGDTQLAEALAEVDARFNDPRPATERPEEDLAFVAACTASTQRIRSRQIRFDYIKSFM